MSDSKEQGTVEPIVEKPVEETTPAVLTDAECDAISYTDMVAGLAKKGEDILDKMSSMKMHLLHMAIGMSGEVGELLEIHHKAMTADIPEYEIDRAHVLEELGDFAFYLEGWGIGWSQVYGGRFPAPIHVGAQGLPERNGELITQLTVSAAHILDIAKRYAIYGKPLNDYKLHPELLRRTACVSEDFANLMDHFGFSTEEVQRANKRKLWERYQQWKYSDDRAHARADKGGSLS